MREESNGYCRTFGAEMRQGENPLVPPTHVSQDQEPPSVIEKDPAA